MVLLNQLKMRKINIVKDVFAGIIVAMVSIPISMGYAQISGLPVVYGLYGSLLPIFIFAFLTTSPQFVVGIDAMPAVMVGSLLAQMGIGLESEEAISLVPVISIMVAAWFVLFYFLKAGRIVKYISTPVMGGFISGVGATIIIMQIPKLFGGVAGTGELFPLLGHILAEMDKFNGVSAALGIGTVIIILAFKKLNSKIPMTIIMMIIGAVLQACFSLDQYGVKLLPQVEGGIPDFILPNMKLLIHNPTGILMESVSIAAVIMAQTLLATGNYAMKYGDKVDNNKELLAYAGMNVASAVVGGCPINGSVSRSGIADSFGARSQLMSISASATMLLVLLFGTPLLKYLPVPILTGIVMTALIGILEIGLMKKLFKSSKNEWLIFMISFISVLLFGTVNGVLIGCILSFAEVSIRVTAPPTSFMGRIPGQGNFYDLSRNNNARPIRNVIIYQFSGNLFFANVDKFQKDIENAIKEDTKCIVVDARGISSVDITAVDRLLVFYKSLQERKIHFYITEHSGRLNDEIRILGGEKLIEDGIVRRTITLALRDVGIIKPYDLEGSEIKSDEIEEEANDELLVEFEWAFGEEAQERLESLAEETAQQITEYVHGSDMKGIQTMLEQTRVQTHWGTLGRFEENEFWEYLEYKLEDLASHGIVDKKQLEELENKIERKRHESEDRLEHMNPRAMQILIRHRARIRKHFEAKYPKEYEHIKKMRKKYDENQEE